MDRPPDFVESFAALDRARLTRMDETARATQLDARQLLLQYVEGLWQDVQRCGERPEVGDKYHALAVVRELAHSLTAIAFDALHDAGSPLVPPPGP